MRITNVSGLRILNTMAQNTKKIVTATQRLSTGLRVNSAADDAVAMARGQRLESEIRGTKQAISNAGMSQDALKTKDGALNEIQSAIQRMRELAVYAASDTITDEDRQYIQEELGQLVYFVEGVMGSSQFNKIDLFKTDAIKYFEDNAISRVTKNTLEIEELKGTIGEIMEQNISLQNSYDAIFDLLEQFQRDKAEREKREEEELIEFDRQNVSLKILNIADLDLTSLEKAVAEVERVNAALQKFNSYVESAESQGIDLNTLKDNNAEFKETLDANLILNDAYRSVFDSLESIKSEYERRREEEAEDYPEEDALIDKLAAEAEKGRRVSESLNEDLLEVKYSIAMGRVYGPTVTGIDDPAEKLNGPSIAESAQFVTAPDDNLPTTFSDLIPGNLTGSALGLRGISFLTREDAAKGITALDEALDSVSRERAMLGAQVNRIDHNISYMEGQLAILEETKSRLMDADIAEEMMTLVKYSLSNQLNGMLLQKTMQMQSQQILGLFRV